MTVAELIAELQTQPQELPVHVSLYYEYTDDISVDLVDSYVVIGEKHSHE